MTKKQLTTLLATLAVLGALVGARLQTKEHRYIVYRGFNEQVLKVLSAQGETFHWEGRNLVLTTRDRRHLLASLSLAADTQENAARVYYQNRGNRLSTSTPNGQPYRRLSPAFDEEGLFCGVTVDEGDFYWRENPTHPHAVVRGPHAGQVAYPNVCDVKEIALITEAEDQVQKLARALFAVDPETQSPNYPGGMFNPMSAGSDPFSVLNGGLFMTMQVAQPAEEGHSCSAACVQLPADFKVLEKPR
jgi:flagellar basal body rod protein FlgC